MRSSFLPKCKPKITRILPYHTNKDRSTFYGDFLVSIGSFFGYDPCLYRKAEIIVILGLHFGRSNDLLNSFWIYLTSSSMDKIALYTKAKPEYSLFSLPGYFCKVMKQIWKFNKKHELCSSILVVKHHLWIKRFLNSQLNFLLLHETLYKLP